MNFAAIAGDDEHTAVEGPYVRLMKTRKWLVLSSGLAALAVFRLYDESALHDLIRFTQVPAWLVGNSILAGLAYLTIQYGLLAYQLVVTYDLTLNERLTFRRADDLAKANDAWRAATDAVREAERDRPEYAPINREAAESRRRALTRRMHALRHELPVAIEARDEEARRGEGSQAWQSAHAAILDIQKELEVIQNNMLDLEMSATGHAASNRAHTERVNALQAAADQAAEDLRRLSRQDPSARRGYKKAEIAIDVLRLLPAGAAALVAITNLVIAFHGRSIASLFQHFSLA